jgi:hypothetical protein
MQVHGSAPTHVPYLHAGRCCGVAHQAVALDHEAHSVPATPGRATSITLLWNILALHVFQVMGM